MFTPDSSLFEEKEQVLVQVQDKDKEEDEEEDFLQLSSCLRAC